jgi:hypothetical protein
MHWLDEYADKYKHRYGRRLTVAKSLNMQAEVRQYEPWSALDGGAGSGCDDLTTICHAVARRLSGPGDKWGATGS